jgi:hypothetical protein
MEQIRRELFFLSHGSSAGKGRMMVAGFEPGSPPHIGAARPLFEFAVRELGFWCVPLRCYDVAPDAQRFYVTQPQTPPSPPVGSQINLIENWFEELRAKAPVR